jgi:hypothetical protein
MDVHRYDPYNVLSVFVAMMGVLLINRTLRLQGTATKASAGATRASMHANRHARRALVIEQRAWMALKDLVIATPLTWVGHEGKIEIISRIMNVGHTPALDVNMIVRMHVLLKRWPIDTYNQISAQLRMTSLSPGFGRVVFMDDALVTRHLMSVVASDVDAIIKLHGSSVPLMIQLVGCIDYGLIFENERHQTGLIYQLQRKSAHPEHGFAIGPTYGQISAQDLALVSWRGAGESLID